MKTVDMYAVNVVALTNGNVICQDILNTNVALVHNLNAKNARENSNTNITSKGTVSICITYTEFHVIKPLLLHAFFISSPTFALLIVLYLIFLYLLS